MPGEALGLRGGVENTASTSPGALWWEGDFFRLQERRMSPNRPRPAAGELDDSSSSPRFDKAGDEVAERSGTLGGLPIEPRAEDLDENNGLLGGVDFRVNGNEDPKESIALAVIVDVG